VNDKERSGAVERWLYAIWFHSQKCAWDRFWQEEPELEEFLNEND